MEYTPIMVSLPKELVQAVLNYLATRPFAEVWQLIAAIQKEHKVEKDGNVGDLEGTG